jgi:hypothetical protein
VRHCFVHLFLIPTHFPMSETPSKTSPLLVAIAWVIVSLPLGWGLYQSIIKSKPLFSSASAPAAQSAPAAVPGR